jgi:hypothetical protein
MYVPPAFIPVSVSVLTPVLLLVFTTACPPPVEEAAEAEVEAEVALFSEDGALVFFPDGVANALFVLSGDGAFCLVPVPADGVVERF